MFGMLLRLMCALAMVACAPALNWRDVRESSLTLALQFPCKPQRVEQAGTGMLQCEADGQRFVLGWRTFSDPLATRVALEELPSSMGGRLRARTQALPGVALPVGALAWPGSGRYALRGGEKPAWLQVWAQGSVLVQAVVLSLSDGSDEVAAQVFLDSVRRIE